MKDVNTCSTVYNKMKEVELLDGEDSRDVTWYLHDVITKASACGTEWTQTREVGIHMMETGHHPGGHSLYKEAM